ncbi:SET domain-containing protein [Apiospora arundinis]
MASSPADSDMSQQHEEMLREHISRSLVEQLRNSSFDWVGALQNLQNPVLRIEACLEERPAHLLRQSTPGMVVSHFVDLSGIASLPPSPVTALTPSVPPSNPDSPTSTKHGIVALSARVDTPHHLADIPTPLSIVAASAEPENVPAAAAVHDVEPSTAGNSRNATPDPPSPESSNQRKDLSGLRPAKVNAGAVEAEADSQRQMHSGDKFPKRRKVKPVGHFLKPSTLDKLIGGIWEQIHGDIDLSPRHLQGPWQVEGQDAQGRGGNQLSVAPATSLQGPRGGDVNRSTSNRHDGSFSQSNAFCRQVTQASRACRSLEVIVQARWVEHFEEYVDSCAANDPTISRTKHNKAAIVQACADFGWSEKELRNKMYIWRGYKEIKDAGGWTTLIFSGMGIYRFCKYRIGFDDVSMSRLRSLRPALEVAADTLHPHWRQLLAVIGESPDRVYQGHPHDWVVSLDGSRPVPLRNTYLRWDPDFSYRQLDECVIDHAAWGGDDPRWTPPVVGSTLMRHGSGGLLPNCDTCGKEQSDDPNLNNCFCFPTLFGCAKTNPSPVLVFRTPDGRNNGLLALCAFERGAPVGEFVGLVTRGYQEVDVMESSIITTTSNSGTGADGGGGGGGGNTTTESKYQIWQGRQGNFTRFVNHSCKANAQYQRFTWMNTQRLILVSKGIEAGTEITVDYLDKYWKGLDKKCLCGESCCRYRRINT